MLVRFLLEYSNTLRGTIPTSDNLPGTCPDLGAVQARPQGESRACLPAPNFRLDPPPGVRFRKPTLGTAGFLGAPRQKLFEVTYNYSPGTPHAHHKRLIPQWIHRTLNPQ